MIKTTGSRSIPAPISCCKVSARMQGCKKSAIRDMPAVLAGKGGADMVDVTNDVVDAGMHCEK